MASRKALIVILFIFIFSPLAAGVDSQPSFLEMKQFYYDKFGEPDHIIVEFDLLHPRLYVKRTYIWKDQIAAVFLWRPKAGWILYRLYNLRPRSA